MNNIPFSLSIYDNAIWIRLIDVCERHKGIDITVYEMENMHSENGDIRIFAAGNTYVDTTSKYLEKDALKKVIHEPSIIVKSRGIIGFEYYDKPFTHKNEMWSYTTNDKRINLKFLYYYLSNNVSFFQQQAVIGKLPQISVKDTDEFSIPIIPLIYQNQIAECLYFIDKQIEQQRKELDALKQHKQALMQQLFPQRSQDTPALRFLNTRKGWKYEELKKITLHCTKKNTKEEETTVLTNSAQYGVIRQQDYFDRDIVTLSNLKNYYIVEVGDFVYNPRISIAAPVGPVSKNNLVRGIISPLYLVFRFNDDNNDFYVYYFQSIHWQMQLKKIANSGARFDRMSISTTEFFDIKVPNLSKTESVKIASLLCSLDRLINCQQAKYDLLVKHKKGLMQQLFPN